MTLGPVAAMPPEIARRRAMALLAEANAGGDSACGSFSTSGPGRNPVPSLVAEAQVVVRHPFVDVARHGHDAMIRVQRA